MTAEETIRKCILSCPLIFKNKLEVYNHLFLTNGNGFKWVNGELIDDSLNNGYSLEDSIHDILLDDFKYDLLESTVELYYEYDKILEIVGIRGSLELEYKQATEVVENGGAVSLITTDWKDVLRVN